MPFYTQFPNWEAVVRNRLLAEQMARESRANILGQQLEREKFGLEKSKFGLDLQKHELNALKYMLDTARREDAQLDKMLTHAGKVFGKVTTPEQWAEAVRIWRTYYPTDSFIKPDMPYNPDLVSLFAEAEKAPTPTNLAKLIAERDKLPEGDPRRKVYDERILKEVQRTGMTIEQTPEGGLKIKMGAGLEEGKVMPSEQVGKFGEFKAYAQTIDQIEDIVQRLTKGKKGVPTGPMEIINKKLDDWGLWPEKDRIELRTLTARLPGLMYALRGKQLSDKELEVALEMMPKMKQDPIPFVIALKNFKAYMNLLLEGKKKAFKAAGYKVGETLELPTKAEEYTVGEIYEDAKGRKAKYLGGGKWQIQK